MRVFIAITDEPKKLLEAFKDNPLEFLYHQEDRTGYKIKTISYLIDEIQEPRLYAIQDGIPGALSKEGKRRYNTILKQLEYLVKEEEDHENTR